MEDRQVPAALFSKLMSKRNIVRIITVIGIVLLTVFSPKNETVLPNPAITKDAPQTEFAQVTRVIDGDTIELSDKRKVRYIGIDTPETVDQRKSVMCFGVEASAENKRLVEGKTIRLEKDVSDIDRFGRLLRYVYVGDVFVNDYLVRTGYAHVSTYPPDVKFSEQFQEAEKEARMSNNGLWGNCK